MKIFDFRHVKELSQRNYDLIDYSLDPELDLIMRIKADERERKEYIEPIKKKEFIRGAIRLSKSNPGYNYFIQEYPHEIDYLDNSILVPSELTKHL